MLLTIQRSRKNHKEALERQMKDSMDKSPLRSEGKALPSASVNVSTNGNSEPKLYSCIECTQKFPKPRMTKKRVFE